MSVLVEIRSGDPMTPCYLMKSVTVNMPTIGGRGGGGGEPRGLRVSLSPSFKPLVLGWTTPIRGTSAQLLTWYEQQPRPDDPHF